MRDSRGEVSPAMPPLADTSGFRLPPTTARGVRTRAALIAAARAVFERDGYLDSRLVDIPATAGCSTGTFYAYFSSKEEVLQAVIEAAELEMLNPGMGRLDPQEASPKLVIEASNRAYFLVYEKNARLMLILEQLAASNPKFRALRARRTHAFAERNARSIRELQQQGLVDPELDAVEASLALSWMVSRMAFSVYCLGESVPLDELVFVTSRLWANALQMP